MSQTEYTFRTRNLSVVRVLMLQFAVERMRACLFPTEGEKAMAQIRRTRLEEAPFDPVRSAELMKLLSN